MKPQILLLISLFFHSKQKKKQIADKYLTEFELNEIDEFE
jgi:hypothetical protein